MIEVDAAVRAQTRTVRATQYTSRISDQHFGADKRRKVDNARVGDVELGDCRRLIRKQFFEFDLDLTRNTVQAAITFVQYAELQPTAHEDALFGAAEA